jgi:hypothetical protein
MQLYMLSFGTIFEDAPNLSGGLVPEEGLELLASRSDANFQFEEHHMLHVLGR